jgi:hypothetical protein
MLDLSASAFALLRDARNALTKSTGHSIDDDAFVSLLVHAALTGNDRDPSRSLYRVTFSTCDTCRTVKRVGGAEDVVVDAFALEVAKCDAEIIDPASNRAAQNPAPALRREVVLRHHERCAVPGCTNAIHLDIHHVDPRAEGGTHDPRRLLALCSAHHDAVHRGVLVVRGDDERGFTFDHADGRPYGSRDVSSRLSQTIANALGGLCALGFKTREAQQMLDRVRHELDETATDETALYAALRAAPSPGQIHRACERAAKYNRQPITRTPPRGGSEDFLLPPLIGYQPRRSRPRPRRALSRALSAVGAASPR